MTGRLRLVVAECIGFVGAVEKTLDRRIGDDLIRRIAPPLFASPPS
jgi:hypothetical protein